MENPAEEEEQVEVPAPQLRFRLHRTLSVVSVEVLTAV